MIYQTLKSIENILKLTNKSKDKYPEIPRKVRWMDKFAMADDKKMTESPKSIKPSARTKILAMKTFKNGSYDS